MSTYRKERLNWEHTKFATPRKVKTKGGYVHTVRTQKITQRFVGDFVVEINETDLIAYMIGRAMNTKGGKSILRDGLVKCTRTRVEKLGKDVVDLPLREGEEYV